jgi:hypothetical protein
MLFLLVKSADQLADVTSSVIVYVIVGILRQHVILLYLTMQEVEI